MNNLHNKKLLSNAKYLRQNMTKEECRLWFDFLKNQTIRFRRQKIIGNYIADFYCARFKLVIELDGSQHYEESGMEKDRERDLFLMDQGYTVLRYTNADINLRFREVCEDILEHMK